MTLREKYRELRNHVFVKDMIIGSVYSTMRLEDQTVSIDRIKQLYEELQREKRIPPPPPEYVQQLRELKAQQLSID